MLSKIKRNTLGKPCSCAEKKQCTGCKFKRVLKPQVYLEEPSRLTVPIVISNYRYKKPYTVNTGTESHQHFQKKKEKHVSPARPSSISRWYRNHRILKQSENEKERKKNEQEKLEKYQKEREKVLLKQLVKQHQREQKLRAKQYKQEEKEQQRYKQELRAIQYVQEQKEQQYQQELRAKQYEQELIAKQYEQELRAKQYEQEQRAKQYEQEQRAKQYEQEQRAKQYEQELRAKQYEQEQKEQRQEPITEKIMYKSPPVEKKAKRVIIGKSTSTKPKAKSRHVTVKRHQEYLPLRKRLANYFYRRCCQFYCGLSIILVLALAIIMLI